MRTVRTPSTIQDEMEQRWLGLPWYLDRVEFSYATMCCMVIFLVLWPLCAVWIAVLLSAVTLPLWMMIINRWKSGKESGYRWDTAYRLGICPPKPRWLVRARRRVVVVAPERRVDQSVFAGTVREGLSVREPCHLVAYPLQSPERPDGTAEPIMLPAPSGPQRLIRTCVEGMGPAPAWFTVLSEVPEGRDPAWLARPHIGFVVRYQEAHG